jgi:pilus assembly protein CpaE
VLAFSSAQSGSGASLLATQVSFALHRLTKEPVLVADMDLMNRTATFYLGLAPGSVQSQTGKVQAGDWTSRVMGANGVEALPAPAASGGLSEASLRPRELIERTRPRYAWIILDLPSVFHRSSVATLLESDRAFLVTSPELPSLHLTRKAVGLLGQLGFGRERLDVLLNRVEKRQGIEASDVAAILNVTVRRSFPNDCLAVERALALGEPLGAGCELGCAVEGFASSLVADARAGRLETAARPVGAEARA